MLADGEPRARRVVISRDGPTLVEGPIQLETEDGQKTVIERFMVALCACRRSQRYPLCAGTHRRITARNPN